DTTLIRSIWTTLCASHLRAVVSYGEPQTFQGRDRRIWAEDVRTEVLRLLQLPQADQTEASPD
ncbi:MAG: 1-acyl-sn-glycerol-3-phosphate acyltransferase, partial [Hydrogenophaga sp.]|nr:1-acyl-sn-glycerol-3-phosphate acyltransferase [Hydrogenophaga sp.]